MPTPKLSDDVIRAAFRALEDAAGNQTEAAKQLGISRSTLQHRLKQAPEYAGQADQQYPPPAAWTSADRWPEYRSRDDNSFLFGVISDNHAGSKYERQDVVEDLFAKFRAAGADRVFHAGNWIDGEKYPHDCHTIGMDAQVRHLIETWPRGLDTYAIHGDDHEGWYGKQIGVDVGRYCEHRFRDFGRGDWFDLGFREAHIKLTNHRTGKAAILAVVHPGGGTAYAVSYTPQRIIAGLEGGEKPAVCIFGHWHKMMAFEDRNVWCLLPGCTQDQTPFMRSKPGASAHVGGMLVRLEQDPETGGIVGCQPTMWRYYIRRNTQDRWSKSARPTLPERRVA